MFLSFSHAIITSHAHTHTQAAHSPTKPPLNKESKESKKEKRVEEATKQRDKRKMRQTTILRILTGVVLLTIFLFYDVLHVRTSYAAQLNVTQLMHNYVEQGKKALEGRIDTLFTRLDRDGDGCIQRKEFTGKAVATVAAISSMEIDAAMWIPAEIPMLDWLFVGLLRLVTMQLMFLAALFVIENVRVLLVGHRLTMDTKSYPRLQAPRATVEEAIHYDTPMTLYERLKIAFFVLSGMALLRFVLCFFFFACGVISLNISVWHGRRREKNPRWFAVCHFVTYYSGMMMLAMLGIYRLNVYGEQAPRDKVKLLLGNHICVVEVVILWLLTAFPSFVSRIENLNVPLFPGLAKASQAILVDRSQQASRGMTMKEIQRRAKDPNAAQLMIFPEGTCDNQKALFKFKRGAFEPGEAVQPVCTKFVYAHFNPAWTGRASGGNDIGDLLLRMFSQFVNRVDIVFLPVYQPSPEERADAALYAQNVQNAMANVLQIPTSEASFDDYLAAARNYGKRKGMMGPSVSPSSSMASTPPPEQASAANHTLTETESRKDK